MHHHRFAPLVAVLLLLACGGAAHGPGGAVSQPPAPSLGISPLSAQLISGGTPVDFTATLTGAAGPISWLLTGPGTLSATRGATVTYTPPATLPSETRATITVTGGGTSAEATILLARASVIVVEGRVIDFLGNPGAAIGVSIGNRSTVTDQTGRFAVEGVSTPYTLTAFSTEQNEAVVYQGLTRADPTILWRQRLSAPDRPGEVAGVIDGGAPASTAGLQTTVVFASPETQTQSSTFTSAYSLPVNWKGGPITTGSVHVLQITSPVPGALPTAFPGYGVRSGVAVLDGATTPGVDVTLTPPSVSSVHGTYTLPADYVFFAKSLFLGFDDGAFMSLGFDDGPGPDFTYSVPEGIDATVELLAQAAGPGVDVLRRETGIAPGSTDITLALPEGAPSLSPADAADPVDTQTEFSWGSFPAGVFIVDFAATSGGPAFHVVTRDTRGSIPQLTGLELPSRARYVWTVTAIGPFGSVDDAAGPHGVTPAGNTLLESFGDARTFTTR